MAQTSTVLSIVGLLLFGTLSSLLSKIVYQTEGEDFDGNVKYFKKPWASTALMFFAMVFCLPIAWIASAIERRRKRGVARDGKHEPLLQQEGEQSDGGAAAKLAAKNATFKEIMILAAPMLFDLIATVLMSIGLLYVTASVYQMLRGAEILFSALFAVLFLKRKLNRLHYGGVLCCMVGISMVGASSLLSSGDSSSSQASGAGMVLLGMGLIVFAQAVQAAQVTVEDYAMNHVGLAPLQVVGYEGLLGSIALFAILMPIVQFIPGKDGEGLHEDSLESIHMITHSLPPWAIPAVLAANSISLLLYNVAGMFVTDELGALSRTVFESARTLFVWLGDLLLYYTPLGFGRLGEGWDRSSYLQAAGFAVLVIGTLIYGRGDDRQAHEGKAAHPDADEDTYARAHAAAHKKKGLVFHFSHTIANHHARNVRERRWAAAINASLAAARLRSGSQHGGEDAA